MTVRAILDSKGHQIQSVEPETKLSAAIRILAERKIGAVLAMSKGRIEGILSERDIVRVLGFLAVWFGVNIIFGVGSIAIGAEGGSVAWQAHIGGFFAGLVLFSLFDPVPRAATDAADASSQDASDRG